MVQRKSSREGWGADEGVLFEEKDRLQSSDLVIYIQHRDTSGGSDKDSGPAVGTWIDRSPCNSNLCNTLFLSSAENGGQAPNLFM